MGGVAGGDREAAQPGGACGGDPGDRILDRQAFRRGQGTEPLPQASYATQVALGMGLRLVDVLGGNDQLEAVAQPRPFHAQFNLLAKRSGDDGQRDSLGERGHQRRHSGKEECAGRRGEQHFAIRGRLLLDELIDPLWILGLFQAAVFTQRPLKASPVVQTEVLARVLFREEAHPFGEEDSPEQFLMEWFVIDENPIEVEDDCPERSEFHSILPQGGGSAPAVGSQQRGLVANSIGLRLNRTAWEVNRVGGPTRLLIERESKVVGTLWCRDDRTESMQLARVVGTVVSTIKNVGLEARKLLLIQSVDERLCPAGRPLVAVDSVGAGVGELVFWCRGKEASFPFEGSEVPTDATIVGIVDSPAHVKALRYGQSGGKPEGESA